jgi:hypothetical protein
LKRLQHKFRSEIDQLIGNFFYCFVTRFAYFFVVRVPYEVSVVPLKPTTPSITQPSQSASKESHSTENGGKAKSGEGAPQGSSTEAGTSASPVPPPVPSPKNIIFLKQRKGTLEPLGQAVVEFTIQPQTPGRQTHSLCIHNVSNGADEIVPITLSPRPLQYIYFPDLANATQLEFGLCYIEKSKKYAKVVPLRMENQSHTSLYVSMRSNLAMQVFIFQDERLSQAAENIYLSG